MAGIMHHQTELHFSGWRSACGAAGVPAGPDFEAADEFDGARLGYAFGTGRQGTGYYREAAGPAAAGGDVVASDTAAAGAHQIYMNTLPGAK